MREWMTNAFLLGLALAFLVHLIMIAVRGQVTIAEPNPLILGLEIAAMIGIMTFTIINMVKIARRRRCRP